MFFCAAGIALQGLSREKEWLFIRLRNTPMGYNYK